MKKPYLVDLALKINVKVGGRNTVLDDAARFRIPLVSDAPTLILGAHVIHPQPGEDSSTSIAAVAGAMDWPLVPQYRGVVSSQHHHEEIIQDLYKSSQDPNRGLVHGGMIRAEVSEGQFCQVLLHVTDAIRKACISLEENYLPKDTFIAVQKRRHTRLFPVSRDQTDRSGNIMPGLHGALGLLQ